MPLEEFLNYALNILEIAVNPGTDAEGNSKNSKVTKTETTVPRKQRVVQEKIPRKMELSNLPLYKAKQHQLIISVAKLSIRKYHVAVKGRP
jgi:hypothetical protein